MLAGCSPDSSEDAQPDTWLRGDVDTRFGLVSKHLRGFDMAMVETGYRYAKLYWACQDQNWGYAEYQLQKIETAVANGIERRPARAASAKMLEPVVALLRSSIQAQDPQATSRAFTSLTNTCNTCHVAEKVEFVTVSPPKARLSSVNLGR